MDKPLIHYDKRIVRRSIDKDYLTQEEFDNFINTLPDRAADSDPLDLEEEAKVAPAAPPEISDAAGAPDEGEPETPAVGGKPKLPRLLRRPRPRKQGRRRSLKGREHLQPRTMKGRLKARLKTRRKALSPGEYRI